MQRRTFSAQTILVLRALLDAGEQWSHGYDLARLTGLQSGTLYPILMRLADRQIVTAKWEDEQPLGRPRRHLYRLTADGVATSQAATRPAPRTRAVRRPAVAR